MVTREHSEPCVLRHPRVRRPPLAVEQRQFAKEITAAHFGQRHFVPIDGLNADAHFPTLDQIHRVARLAGVK